MIRDEYIRFLSTLNSPEVSEDVRKIANLVLDNLDLLIPLGTHQGQRVKEIVSLAQNKWDTTPEHVQPVSHQAINNAPQFSKLKTLKVGPFRGFAAQETFDLESSIVLAYGPNGTGKTSFCEALEYGLLGHVSEADNRRFRDQKNYLINANVGYFDAPQITAVNDSNEEVKVEPNNAQNRFCFVEKNRIENFSRIAAQAPAKQAELISTLFGLDSFNEFVKNFTPQIDPKYIDLTGEKAQELKQKQESLSAAQQQIEDNNTEIGKINTEEQELASQYREGATFSQVLSELNGDSENTGLIENLENELQKPTTQKTNLKHPNLIEIYNSITKFINEIEETKKQLDDSGEKVSYKTLYEAVTQLQTITPDHCPACKTPLTHTVQDPYSNATEELQKLQHLAKLQEQLENHRQNLNHNLVSLGQIISVCLTIYPNENTLSNYQPNAQPSFHWWTQLHETLEDGTTPWFHIKAQVEHAEKLDQETDKTLYENKHKQQKLNRLRTLKEKMDVLRTRRNVAERAINDAKEKIRLFKENNRELIAASESEKPKILRNIKIADAYKIFADSLNQYMNSLPGKLVADLGETTVTLYNAFNRNDAPADLLTDLKLPVTQNQRLEISFNDRTSKFYDALHILSEGHIRCVGLAILLAKNIKENCPVLIFDDPVNAIDEDHKESIRKALFDDQYFSEKQILLTTHGEEFFKDIQTLLPKKTAEQAHTFTFLQRLGDPSIRVDFNSSPRNYIIAAREHFDRGEIRDALAKSRRALEALTRNKVWQYVRKYGDGSLTLKLSHPKASIELRQLTEQLTSKIGKGNFSDPNRDSVYDPLNALLGFGGDSREWGYLNKGTHDEEDMPEFDRAAVSSILSSLEALDAALH